MDRPLYNELVAYYELVEGRNWQREIGLITSILRAHKSKSIIDLGCGTGYHVRALTKLGFQATGIDISQPNIQFARKRAKEENIRVSFVVGSDYEYQPDGNFDAALCLNWSIPVKDGEVKRFLDNTWSLLRPGGILIFDFERASQIVWSDVGKAIAESWVQGAKLVARVSVGRIISSVLYSNDVYILYPKLSEPLPPNERSRYKATCRGSDVKVYVDSSCVRFFSIPEIRDSARRSRFRSVANYILLRKKYKRNYAVLKKTA